MKILLLISEMWNDKIYPNNNMTNWFKDFEDVDIATITLGDGIPFNGCCKKYFQVTDNMMIRSVLSRKKVGKVIKYEDFPDKINEEVVSVKRGKRISLETARLARDFIWRYGKYDLQLLKNFIEDFDPDIIFSLRYGSVKMCRLEEVVSSICNVPMVAYTGDDEYSLRRINFNPLFWIRRLWARAWLRKRIPKYNLYYSMSEEQMRFYADKFGVKTKFLVKCGDFNSDIVHKSVLHPINIVYAGKLYCGRWKTLSLIAEQIRRINSEGIKIILNIYTGDRITKKQNKLLNDGVSSVVKGFVSADELKNIYNNSDLALHVESLELKQRLIVAYSFSTKIMDLLSSGCAVMAVCHDGQAGYEYLKSNDLAFIANDKSSIFSTLKKISDNKDCVLDYANKAFDFGSTNHCRNVVQHMIYEDFQGVIKNT